MTSIEPSARFVHAVGPDGQALTVDYDKLVIATGAEPARPPIPGLELEGVYLLHTMEDQLPRASRLPGGTAPVIGGGYIGLEMADALTRRGLRVTVVEQLPTVMPTVAADLGRGIGDELQRHGVDVRTGTAIERIEPSGDRVAGSGGFRHEVDLVLVAVGGRRPASRSGCEVRSG